MPMTWNRLRYGIGAVLGENPAGRRLTVYPDDVFIVSYPRSGNTWIRFLVGNLLDPDDPITFANVELRVPEIYFFSDQQLLALTRPRILKSHEVLTLDTKELSAILFVIQGMSRFLSTTTA